MYMQTRRQALTHSARVAALLAATGLFPRYALAYNQDAFAAKTVADVVKALGAAAPVESPDVFIEGPDLAENGDAVALTIRTTLPGVRQLLLLVEKNPTTLIAVFNVTDRVEANLATRAKLAQSTNVYTVALMADGKAWFASKKIQVIQGGCGA